MATLDQVTKEIIADLDNLSNNLVREVALDYQTNSRKRIFTDGIKSDGSQMGTYSPVTKAIKRKKGRFTSDKVNLRDTETLVNSYIVEPTRNGYEVGFKSGLSGGVSNTEKKKKIEKKYGEVFEPTNDELDKIDDLIDRLKFF